jgi:hypothetical protein
MSFSATARTLGVTIRCVLFDRPQDVDLGFVDYPDSDVTSHGVPEVPISETKGFGVVLALGVIRL